MIIIRQTVCIVHEFAQLRAIGATYQQIKSVVKKERDKIAKPCIVLGTVIGFLVNIVLPLHFYWIPSIVCAVISGIFIWIITALAFQAPAKMAASTSPIEAQHTQATNYFRSVGAKRKLTPIRIGWMYCRANRKKAAYTFLSLIMSGILMFGVFSILNAINPERLASQPYQGNSDVFVLLNSTADEESTYDLMKSTPFTEEQKQKLYNISGVKDVYELYMLDGILTNSEGEKFELSIENAVNPETFKNEIVEGMQPSHELQNGAIPVAINRQSPYYQKLNMQLQVGDYLPYIIDTGYGQKEVALVVSGFVENSDTGLVIYTSGENMKSLSEIGCKGEYRAVQVVRYYHVVYQNRVNADAYHYEEALKTDSEQGFEVVVSYLPPFPVRHSCKRDRRYRTVKVNLYHAPVEDNGYQYGHDFHAQAHKACFHDK